MSNTYVNIVQVLVPLYLVILLGYAAGRWKMADDFLLDRLNAFNAKFALPGLLYRNIATTDLYIADWRIVGASITFKVTTGVAFFAYAYLTRAKYGPPAERSLVMHSVLTFPNYVVIGIPVLSSMFTPALVKVYMGLLLMEQVSLHLTYVAVVAEMFCARPPAPVVGEHAHGALHLNGPPLRTDAHGWALGVVGATLSRTGGGGGEDAAVVALSGRAASLRGGAELKPRLSLSRNGGGGGEATHALLAAALDAGEHTHGDAAGAHDEESAAQSASPGSGGGGGGGVAAGAGATAHAMPEHANAALRVLRIVKDRLLHNPMVLGAVAGVITTMAVKARDRKAKLPYILDMTSLYLNNCVLGISLFNFGLFAYTHGIISCGYRRAAEVVFLRSVVSPICCLCVMLLFGLRGEPLKIMTMQGALPQAVSSFVVFKEFKIQPDVFSTSTTVGTALCLPVMIIWYFLLSSLF